MRKIALKKYAIKKPKSVSKKSSLPNKKRTFFIAGIGASAGGLEALKVFFDNMSDDCGIAFVIVQHLDPLHKSMLTELLGKHTSMKVCEITDKQIVKPNSVYIIPPNKDLQIYHGTLHLIKPSESRVLRRPIDSFFHSLAEDQKDKAIGIILSGTGTEGALGLKAIKAEGGITIVQNPSTAKFSGMPQSAIVAKVADYILSPEKIPSKLIHYVNKRSIYPTGTTTELTIPFENQLKKILQIIRNQTGYDFFNYKLNTIMRRTIKRIALSQIDSIDEYITFLKDNPTEVQNLYKEFLIGVTSFFRDKEVFNCVEKKAIPYLLQKCIDKKELRVWVCGCSTGEEAYSLAILFKEALEKSKQYIKVIIFASDIDKDTIAFARSGIYPEGIAADVSSDRLTRYFIKLNNTYQIKKEIREMVVFAHQNVIKDPPFSKMDMITCRNLMIYMNSELQKKIIPVFHYSLNTDGILLLGISESIGENNDLFSAFDSKVKIYKKKNDTLARKPVQSFELPNIHQQANSPSATQTSFASKKMNVSGLTEKILLENYAPPSVIIDKNNDVLYFSGNTGLYLVPPTGEARFSLPEMAKKGLRLHLEPALSKVRSTKSEVKVNDVEVKVNSHFQKINLIVKPVITRDSDTNTLIVIFEPTETSKKQISKNSTVKKDSSNLNFKDLEKELKLTREHLQMAVNELESSNENLQTTNEEFQSSNEELQSTNEELETSREELQSVNEELITVNTELESKIEQLSQSNDDLSNLLRSIEVATVFLDRNLKIKRFTPAATKIFNIIPSDIDRPIAHLTSNLAYKTIDDDVKASLKTLEVKSLEVHSNNGIWYHMRIIPYRTSENIIEGVLITFVDITEQKSVEERLKKSNEHLNLIMENLPAIPFTYVAVGKEIKIAFVGSSCEKITGFLPEQFISKTAFWIKRIHPDDKTKVIASFKNIPKKERVDVTFRWKCANGKYKIFTNYLRHVPKEIGRQAYAIGVWQEQIQIKQTKLKK